MRKNESMKEIKLYQVEKMEHYLVYCPDWSPSGYDICEGTRNRELISQNNGEDLSKREGIRIYELPPID